MTTARRDQLTATRNRLNDLGDRHYYAAGRGDGGNLPDWDGRRIRVRNRINARLARA